MCLVLESIEWIIWIITPACNLSCIHCYTTLYSRDKMLGLNDIERVLSEAVDIGIEHIHYTGGEPFTRRDIIDILEATLDYGLTTSVFTNTTLLGEGEIKYLAKRDIPVYTSFDAPYKELFEEIRGRGVWDRVLENIQRLMDSGVPVHVNICVSKKNYMVVGETIEFLLGLGVESISLIPAMAVGRALANRVYIERDEYLYALRQAEDKACEYGVDIAVWCTPFIASIEWAKHLYGGNCRYWNVLDIAPNGDALLCDVIGVRVANVVRDGLRESWRKVLEHPLYRKAMEIPDTCRGCSIASYCRGGCYARTYLLYNRVGVEKDPLCPIEF